jgi:cob(I)alamin adenosyltransferase
MKIYTKTGDSGETGLFAGPRVSKDSYRIEAYGAVDELNSVLGVAVAAGLPDKVEDLIVAIQNKLFAVGAELATPDPGKQGTSMLTDNDVEKLERAIDNYEAELPALKNFILPGGCPAAAQLHVARCVCRRAERRVVTLMRISELEISSRILRYVNRLSDLLFVLSRAVNQKAGVEDIPWKPGG